MGSRVLAGELRPDALIALDVNHDYAAAPGIGDRRMPPLAMGKGFTLTTGAIVTESLNAYIEKAAADADIPYQMSVAGRDTGTDGMAAVFAAIDAPATSIGFPTRNMHTISESGHTGDVLCAIHAMVKTVQAMDAENLQKGDFAQKHVRLDEAELVPKRS